MSALYAVLAFVAFHASATPHACPTEPSVRDDSVVCQGVTYEAGHYRLVHDSDDGDIMAVQVWQ